MIRRARVNIHAGSFVSHHNLPSVTPKMLEFNPARSTREKFLYQVRPLDKHDSRRVLEPLVEFDDGELRRFVDAVAVDVDERAVPSSVCGRGTGDLVPTHDGEGGGDHAPSDSQCAGEPPDEGGLAAPEIAREAHYHRPPPRFFTKCRLCYF